MGVIWAMVQAFLLATLGICPNDRTAIEYMPPPALWYLLLTVTSTSLLHNTYHLQVNRRDCWGPQEAHESGLHSEENLKFSSICENDIM